MAVNVGSILKTLAKLGVAVGPFVVPAIQKLIDDPEKLRELHHRLTELLRRSGASADEMLETIDVLREQVQELAESADDEKEVVRAKRWAKQLDGFEKAAKLLQAPGAQQRDLKQLRKKINTLRTEILNAHIMELADDKKSDVPARRRLRLRRSSRTDETPSRAE